jgi:hypothetical protein
MLKHVGQEKLRELIDLLELVRGGNTRSPGLKPESD